MPEDLKLSQIGSSQLPPPFRGLHSPGVRKNCKIIFTCYFRKFSIVPEVTLTAKMVLLGQQCEPVSHFIYCGGTVTITLCL